MTISAFAVASHWPYVRSHLLLDRRPAASRALELLAHQVADNGGDPVPMSRRRLHVLGLTPGEAGNAWAALSELEEAGVLARYRGSGRRPDLWTFVGAIAERWRVPWRWGGREVEIVVGHCICRAGSDFAARFPGQSVAGPPESELFRLPPDAHLGFRAGFRAANAEPRAASSLATRENRNSSRGYDAPLHLSPMGGRRTSSSSEEEEVDEATRTLAEAIGAATGRPNWLYPGSEPHRVLQKVALSCNGDLDRLAQELRLATGVESPVVLARQAGERLAMLRGELLRQEREERERARHRLGLLQRLPELDDDQATELADLLGTLGDGA